MEPWHKILLPLFTLLAAFAAEGDGVATGYRPSPMGNIATISSATATTKSLLKATSSSLPSSWDSRDYGWVTPVRNQYPWGTCWTFAAYAVLETQLLKAGRGEYNFSEKNMASLHGFESDFDDGGNNDMATAYLLRWSGAIAESNDVYRTDLTEWQTTYPSVSMYPAIQVHEVVWVPARTSLTDNNTLKEAITNYGAVATMIYWNFDKKYDKDDGSYYCNAVTGASNHAIAVIGWDDDYDKSNFATTPEGNGAWLIKNSWGTGQGTNGYNYVSYYDTTFATEDGAVFIPANEGEEYDAVYGYDALGPVTTLPHSGEINPTAYSTEAAVFTSAWNEELAAVGFFALSASLSYEISIYTNVTKGAASPISGGKCAYTQKGNTKHPGYNLVSLTSPVILQDRTNFAIVYRLTVPKSKYYHVINCTANYSNGSYYSYAEHDSGETYLGKYAGSSFSSWIDASDYYSDTKVGLCLKAYTRTTLEADDGPDETEDGTAALADLNSYNSSLYTQYSGSFGAYANIVGLNGRTLWANWLLGLDPSDATSEFEITGFTVSNSVPYVSFTPNLESARKYTLYGKTALTNESWEAVGDANDPTACEAKFFKVGISQQ